jgi:hypothetical protein
MAATGFTPISLYYSATASAVPLAANLTAGELALNTADGKLYYKNSSNAVTLLASATSTIAAGSNTQLQFNSSGVLGASASLTWSGTVLSTTGFTASSDSSFTSTGALTISKGTTGQQPGSPVTGMLRYNTTTNQFEGYSGATPAWASVGGGATGGGSDQIFWQNGQTVTTNYTITASTNAGTFGPISIATSVTVTVPTGSTWSVI